MQLRASTAYGIAYGPNIIVIARIYIYIYAVVYQSYSPMAPLLITSFCLSYDSGLMKTIYAHKHNQLTMDEQKLTLCSPHVLPLGTFCSCAFSYIQYCIYILYIV